MAYTCQKCRQSFGADKKRYRNHRYYCMRKIADENQEVIPIPDIDVDEVACQIALQENSEDSYEIALREIAEGDDMVPRVIKIKKEHEEYDEEQGLVQQVLQGRQIVEKIVDRSSKKHPIMWRNNPFFKIKFSKGLHRFQTIFDLLPAHLKPMFAKIQKAAMKDEIPDEISRLTRSGVLFQTNLSKTTKKFFKTFDPLFTQLEELTHTRFPWNAIGVKIIFDLKQKHLRNDPISFCSHCIDQLYSLQALFGEGPIPQCSYQNISKDINITSNAESFVEINTKKKHSRTKFQSILYFTACHTEYASMKAQFPKLRQGEVLEKIQKKFRTQYAQNHRKWFNQACKQGRFFKGWNQVNDDDLHDLVSLRLGTFTQRIQRHLRSINNCSVFPSFETNCIRQTVSGYYYICLKDTQHIYAKYTIDTPFMSYIPQASMFQLNLSEFFLSAPVFIPRSKYLLFAENFSDGHEQAPEYIWTGNPITDQFIDGVNDLYEEFSENRVWEYEKMN